MKRYTVIEVQGGWAIYDTANKTTRPGICTSEDITRKVAHFLNEKER